MRGMQPGYVFGREFTCDEFSDFPQSYGTQQQSASARLFNPSAATENGLPQQNVWPANTMFSTIGSPASALYATEGCTGFSHYDFQENNTAHCSQQFESPDQHESPYQQSGALFFGDPSSQTQTSSISQYVRPDGSYRNNLCSLSENEHLLHLKNKLLADFDDSNRRSLSLPFDANQDHGVLQNFSASHFANMNLFGQPPGCPSTTSGNGPGSPSAVQSTKTRIRWTQELHDRFVDCVNRLGGPDKAKPKAIVKLMDTEGLTILHVKSHLQKYRNAKYVPESAEGRSEKKTSTNNVDQMDVETGMQIKEALQLQLHLQRHLYEQLYDQRNLQLRIEEQGKQLKMMLEQQQKTAQNHMESTNSNGKYPDNLPPTPEDPEVLVTEWSDDNGFPVDIN